MTEVGLGQRGSELLAEDAALARAGVAILDENWLGHATRASSRLYPHQWSWDAACISIAYSHYDQARAETELRSLFEGQWRNGLLPHIRFTDGARYFPGPEFWQTELSPDAPPHPRTSGIVQPPVHATAVWEIYRNAADIERRRGVPARAHASARRVARLPLPRAHPRRRGARRALASVGVGRRQLAALGRGARAHRAAAGGDPRLPARRHRGRRLVAAADERGVRPLRLSRQVLSRAGLRPGPDPGRVPFRDPGRPLQLDPGARRRRPCVDRPRRRRGPGAVRARCGNDTIEPRREALERAGRHLPGLRPAGRQRMSPPAPGAASRRSTAASHPSGRTACSRQSESSRSRWTVAGPSRPCPPTIPRSTRPATGAGRSGP